MVRPVLHLGVAAAGVFGLLLLPSLPILCLQHPSVRAYQLLPEAVVPTVGHLLPVVEVAVGALLVLGLLTRVAAAVSSLLLVAFIVGISAAWARGLEIDCGCFGNGGFRADATDAYPWDIARDLGLLLLSVWLVVRPRSRFSLDAVLFPTRPATYDVHDERTPDVEEVR